MADTFAQEAFITKSGQKERPLNRYVRHYERLYGDFTAIEATHRHRRSAEGLRITFKSHGIRHNLVLHPEQWHAVLGNSNAVYYSGVLEGQSEGRAHGYFRDGAFDGVLHYANDTIYIEHSTKFFPEVSSHNMIAYKASDVVIQSSDPVCSGGLHYNSTGSATLKSVPNQRYEQHANQEKTTRRARRGIQLSQAMDTCQLKLVADHTFVKHMKAPPHVIKMELISIMKEVDDLFAGTSFVPNVPIHLALSDNDPITVYESASDYPAELAKLADETVGDAADLLYRFSRGQWNGYCLAHLFTHRDFNDGVLGLAWVGKTDPQLAGGICQTRTLLPLTDSGNMWYNLNSGLNTNTNFGSPVTKAVNVITIAHEIGHNFGSDHDPSTLPCTGDPKGNYIMYPKATKLVAPNNRRFSPCSISQIGNVITEKATCFSRYPLAMCGNGIVDGMEECDGGFSNDTCCMPDCRLAPGAVCSGNDDCCTPSCQFAAADFVCRAEEECVQAVHCPGNAKTCPEAQWKPDSTTTCGTENSTTNAYMCSSGVCAKEQNRNQATVCSLFEALPCAVETCANGQPDQCKACCSFPGEGRCLAVQSYCSKPYHRHEPGCLNGTFLAYYIGQPCDSSNGYCTDTATCHTVNFQTPDTLGFQNARTFLEYTWYYWVAGVGCFAVFLAIYCIMTHFCPSERRLRRLAIEQRFIDARHIRKTRLPFKGHGGVGPEPITSISAIPEKPAPAQTKRPG